MTIMITTTTVITMITGAGTGMSTMRSSGAG
jgi:hypothetical protein